MIEQLRKMMNRKESAMIVSALIGLGLAAMFRKSCNGRSCVVYSTPNLSEVEGKVFGWEDKCYSYTPKDGDCKEPLDSRIRPKPMKG